MDGYAKVATPSPVGAPSSSSMHALAHQDTFGSSSRASSSNDVDDDLDDVLELTPSRRPPPPPLPHQRLLPQPHQRSLSQRRPRGTSFLGPDPLHDNDNDNDTNNDGQPLATPTSPVALVSASAASNRPLPLKYLGRRYKLNSYFAIRVVRIVEVLVALDVLALAFFYGYKRDKSFAAGSLYVANPVRVVLSREQSCRPTVALAALLFHLFPASLVLVLPASGLRVFEPFKREQRVDHAGRLQKVKRTVFLQFCELTGVVIFLYAGSIAAVFLYFLTSGRLLHGCRGHPAAYVFCASALAVYYVTFLQIRYFARFREHLKMQLGAFKESDQTGDIKAHMLRAKLRRRQQQQLRQHLKAGVDGSHGGPGAVVPPPPPPKRSVIVADIKKRLFRGAQLGDLRLLRRSLRLAKAALGPHFAKELFPDATLAFGFVVGYGFAKKNPMHVAAYQGNIAAMELLFRAKFDVNAYDKVSRVRLSTGDLFWYLASFFIRKPVVSAEESHASIFKTTLVTPLHCAVSTGRVDAVRWLLQHGADVNLCSKSSFRYESRLPPIFLADHPDIVRELLVAGANHLAIPDPGHMNTLTVLQLAYLRHNYAVAQVLEDWGGDVALTPLHTAAAMNDTVRIRYFLRKKVDPDCLGELGYIGLNQRTPLHWAAVNGAVDAVEFLLASRADANAQDARGRTPLHWAARVNRLAVVRVLLAHGADANIVDESDMTPIICAACAGGASDDMFRAMTSHGGDINHQLRATGDTALHIAVKLDDQPTALAILSLGGDISRTNHDGFRAIDCTTSTRLQFEIKRAAGTRDVMISYTHSHKEFALKLRRSLEDANVTTWLDLMDPSGIGGGAVWREEIARGITNAAVVLCVITDDYAQSEWCLKELALAKQVGTPILAISTESTQISEELQVYLYTRQIIPFEPAITAIDKAAHDGDKTTIAYQYDDAQYKAQVRILLDGLRDEIEKRKEVTMRRIIRRADTLGSAHSAHSLHGGPAPHSNPHSRGGDRRRRLATAPSGVSSTQSQPHSHDPFHATGFDERVLADTVLESGSFFDTSQSVSGPGGLYSGLELPLSSRGGGPLSAQQPLVQRPAVASGGSSRRYVSGYHTAAYELGGASLSRVSSASSLMSEDFTDTGGSVIQTNSIVMDKGGYYFHRPDGSGATSSGLSARDVRGSILETFEELESVTAGGEQFVFICHGDQHGRFVKKLCVDMCREGGFRCYLDQRSRRLHKLPSKIDEGGDENASSLSPPPSSSSTSPIAGPATDDGMSRRILEAKEAILKCSAFVVVLSEKTLASQLVKDQLAFAEDKGKRIIPVVVNRLDFGLDMKYSLSRSDFYHFFSKGDMMGFAKSFERLLDSLREEVYGITVDTLPRGFGAHLSAYSGSVGGNDDHSGSGVHDSFLSVGSSSSRSVLHGYHPHPHHANGGGSHAVRRRRLSTHSLSMHSDRGVSGGGGDALSPFGLPSSVRRSQSFLGSASFVLPSTSVGGAASVVASSSRGLSSDMSLSQAMIGNFSSLMGRISDEEDDEYADLSYAGVEGGDDDSSDDDAHGEAVAPTAVVRHHFVDIAEEMAEPKAAASHSASSISILERKSDDAAMSIDGMLGAATAPSRTSSPK